MITFLGILFVLFVIFAIMGIFSIITGKALIVIFGDLIICALIIYAIIRFFKHLKK